MFGACNFELSIFVALLAFLCVVGMHCFSASTFSVLSVFSVFLSFLIKISKVRQHRVNFIAWYGKHSVTVTPGIEGFNKFVWHRLSLSKLFETLKQRFVVDWNCGAASLLEHPQASIVV